MPGCLENQTEGLHWLPGFIILIKVQVDKPLRCSENVSAHEAGVAVCIGETLASSLVKVLIEKGFKIQHLFKIQN